MRALRWDEVSEARQLARLGKKVSRAAQGRLQWMLFYFFNGRNAARTCRRFGISRQTFYCWKRRFDRHDLSTLEGHSHRPRRVRQPTWPPDLAERVLARRKLRHRPWAIRKPKYWRIQQPGDLVEIDTKEVRRGRGVILKHFGARDVVSRWDVVEAHQRATSLAAARFLEVLAERMPFTIAAFQVDGGSEFAAEFEEACGQKQIPLFVLPPRSPKLNGHVERSNRTHNEEFYELAHGQLSLEALNQQLRSWENTYNCVRPHQALGYLTPQEFLLQWKCKSKKAKCH